MLFSNQRRKRDCHTVAFYNLENIFDLKDDPNTLDDDYTPEGRKKWTLKRYRKKLANLARTIYSLGKKKGHKGPVIIGVAEVENKMVVEDLLQSKPLNKLSYGYVHHDSPDERGIDTALLYDPRYFEVLHSEPIPLLVYTPEGERDFTRDILYVYGRLNGEEFHIFVNHWPSRRNGDQETEYKRIEAAQTLSAYMDTIRENHQNPHFIVMGDFNDGPKAKSVQELMRTQSLYNPMEKLITPERGSANYKRSWSLFDQIMISDNLFDYRPGSHSFTYADIFDAYFLTEWKGKYQGNPFRTYVGKKYLGGYSDHFPVYIQLTYHA